MFMRHQRWVFYEKQFVESTDLLAMTGGATCAKQSYNGDIDGKFILHIFLSHLIKGSQPSRQKLQSRLYFKSSCGVLGKVFNQQ